MQCTLENKRQNYSKASYRATYIIQKNKVRKNAILFFNFSWLSWIIWVTNWTSLKNVIKIYALLNLEVSFFASKNVTILGEDCHPLALCFISHLIHSCYFILQFTNQSQVCVISREICTAEKVFTKCFSVLFILRITGSFFCGVVMSTEASLA